MKQIPDKIYELFIYRLKPVLPILQKEKKIIVAVSGGPDSMCLLFLLTKFSLKHKIEIYPVYVNHRIRSKKDIERDIRTIQTFCKQNNLNLTVAEINPTKTDENTLRELRYKKLFLLAKKFKCSIIATGHTLNDVVETFFLNLLRGSGIKGLCSIPPVREINNKNQTLYIIRPILDISKHQILEILTQQKIRFNVDKSNFALFYKRNLLRNKIFPLFARINSNFEKNVLSASVLLKQVYEFVSEIVEQKMKQITKVENSNIRIDLRKFLMYNPFIKQEIFFRIITWFTTKFNLRIHQGYKNIVEKLIKFTSSQTKDTNLTKTLKAYKTSNYLIIAYKKH
ncbi:MAG: tRNA lysidine(34) synthetase TilS [Endomicrobia bacterium]|nr:tRNA lysidine(34) synthetase TilS [Endomicrobiia bacterium]